MRKNIKLDLCKLLAVTLIIGNISVQGVAQKTNAEEPTIESTVESTEELTTKSALDYIVDLNEMTKDETETTEETTEESSAEPVTEETTEAPTKAPGKKVYWNGKVVKNATMKGIDVSHHNGKINWKKVAKSDVDYVIIRCGYGNNRKKQDDGRWKEYIEGCEKYKIPYGVYLYSYAKTKADARSEAEHVLRLVKGLHMSFPIYYDMEDYTQARLSNKKKKQIADTFLGIISQHGYECGIYANLNWWTQYLSSLSNKVYYKWIARYGKTCGYKGVYQMWQCSSTAKISGINGYTDLNFWYDAVRTNAYDIYTDPNTKRPARMKIGKVYTGRRWAKVSWTHQKKTVGYKVEYSRYKTFKNSLTRYTNGTSVYLGNLKSKRYYYFRLKAYKYKDGKRLYSKEWSKVVRKKVK